MVPLMLLVEIILMVPSVLLVGIILMVLYRPVSGR